MSGIREAIKRQELVPYGIQKWNDLLRKTFWTINKKCGTNRKNKNYLSLLSAYCQIFYALVRLPQPYFIVQSRISINPICEGYKVRCNPYPHAESFQFELLG